MLQKESFFSPTDSSGIFRVKVIQTRRCSPRRHAKIGKFLRVVIKTTKVRFMRKRKRRIRALTVRTKHATRKTDGMIYWFIDNTGVLLRRRMNALGKEIIGPSGKQLKIKKFKKSFLSLF
jgi:ribosomal protein L14